MSMIPDPSISTPAANPEELRVCSMCGQSKPPSEYYFEKRSNGLLKRCKACVLAKQPKDRRMEKDPEGQRERCRDYDRYEAGKAKRAEYRRKNLERILARNAAYRESVADEKKAKDAEYRKANHELIANRHREWREANPEAWAVLCARSKHRRRANEAAAECTLTTDEWIEILRLQGHKCARCRRKFSPRLVPHKDHVVPVSKGGGLTAANVQGLCGKCNNEKYVDDTDYRGILPGFFS